MKKRNIKTGPFVWSDDDEKTFVFSTSGVRPPRPPRPPFPPGMFGKGFCFTTGSTTAQNIYQVVDDGQLELLVILAGIEPSSLKLRSKATKLSLSAELKDKYIDKLGNKEINYTIDLAEEVIPEDAKASYKDGILSMTFPLANPGEEVKVEEFEEE